MGLKRLLWRSTGLGRTVDTIMNIADEGSIIEGIKKTVKEDLCEDNPITSRIYQAGQYDGKVEGYEEASDQFETKLIRQADEFLKQKQIFESERDAYEQLLDEYDAKIEALKSKLNKSQEEKEYLYQLLLRKKELCKLK